MESISLSSSGVASSEPSESRESSGEAHTIKKRKLEDKLDLDRPRVAGEIRKYVDMSPADEVAFSSLTKHLVRTRAASGRAISANKAWVETVLREFLLDKDANAGSSDVAPLENVLGPRESASSSGEDWHSSFRTLSQQFDLEDEEAPPASSIPEAIQLSQSIIDVGDEEGVNLLEKIERGHHSTAQKNRMFRAEPLWPDVQLRCPNCEVFPPSRVCYFLWHFLS